jgi:protease-4
MSMDADTIVDRRRLRRKLKAWRAFAVLLVLVAVIGGLYVAFERDLSVTSRPGAYIARVKIQGLIRGDTDRVEALERLGKSSQARAVIVHIDSPGGTTAGSEQLHDALRRVAEQKPMVVVVDTLAASGGYIAAMAGDHIVAQGTSLVGSIGVLFQYPNVSELMKTLGVKVEEIKSSPLKAAPSAFEPTSPEAKAAIEAIVRDSYTWFRGLVSGRRKLDGAALDRVADGRVFTGRQAIEVKLVDQLGDERTAIAWLAKERGIDQKTPVRDWSLKDRLSDLSFLHLGAAMALDALGLKDLAQRFATAGTVQAIERLNLDGLLALWHPPSTN